MLLDAIAPTNPAEIGIQIDPDIADGVYCNVATVHYAETEITLDFILLHPQRERGRMVSRVLMNPKHAKNLVRALQSAIEAHESHWGEIRAHNAEDSVNHRALMTETEAVAMARAAVEGSVEIGATSALSVEEDGTNYIIEWRPELAAHTRGPDYDAHIVIDRATHTVLELLVGS